MSAFVSFRIQRPFARVLKSCGVNSLTGVAAIPFGHHTRRLDEGRRAASNANDRQQGRLTVLTALRATDGTIRLHLSSLHNRLGSAVPGAFAVLPGFPILPRNPHEYVGFGNVS